MNGSFPSCTWERNYPTKNLFRLASTASIGSDYSECAPQILADNFLSGALAPYGGGAGWLFDESLLKEQSLVRSRTSRPFTGITLRG
jgi:hypothetical protein